MGIERTASGPQLRSVSVLRRTLTALVTLALLAGVGAAGYWAGTNAVAPPALPVASPGVQTYVAATGTVGRTDTVAVTAAWTTIATVYSVADGVVTAVRHRAGALAAAGEVLATVDLRPVVAAAGPVPMFRALSRGASGPDVRQLQGLLRAEDYLKAKVTGRFDDATVAAVKRWQRAVGVRADGVVRAGDLVFVAQLPARLVVVPAVGSRMGAGAELVHVLGTTPSFAAIVDAGTRAELATGMSVSIAAPGGSTWTGELGALEPTQDGQRYQAPLTGSLCGASCDAVAVDGETALKGTVVLVPERSGVVVPVSALVQTPSGAASVALADGTRHEVTVVAEADGFAVVDGLPAGTAIALPAEPAP
jgi:peptidoglycan hydrolase-like protein with peptidoglycan-binding domain